MIDKKMLSTVVVIIVIIASMAAVIAYDANKDNSSTSNVYNILARVNTAGSGIYINQDSLDSDATGDIPVRNGTAMYIVAEDGTYTTDETCANAWRGLVVGTPGTTSIQHVQMQTLVENMGLTFQSYLDGDTPSTSDNCVYYIATITNYDLAMKCKDNNHITLDMGIIWEPQYSYIITVHATDAPTFVEFALTQNFFGNHTCCVLAGYSSYVNSHTDVTIRFLAAYIESVEWMLTASDTSNPNYSEENHKALVTSAVESVFSSAIKDEDLTEGEATAIIENAISNITYCFGDGSDGTYDLHELKQDIADIIEKNKSSLQRTMSSLGFTNALQFANRFVDDSYLIQACSYEKQESYATTTNITVAAISGDIHQFALQMGVNNGIFEKYGISITISTQTNGAGVAVALQNGGAQFGLLGAPPATITAVNGALISV